MNPLVYFLLFLKASLFSTGGSGSIPSLHQDLISEGWATETQFAQSIAIGQISPGPNGLWVISLGYLTYGYLGVLLALIAVTLPPLLVLGVAAGYKHVEGKAWVQNCVHCIGLAVVGMLLSVSWEIISRSAADWRSWLIGLAALLAASRRMHSLLIILLAGFVGLLEQYQHLGMLPLLVGAILLTSVGCAATLKGRDKLSFIHRRVGHVL